MRLQVNECANRFPEEKAEHKPDDYFFGKAHLSAWFSGRCCPNCGTELYGLWMSTERVPGTFVGGRYQSSHEWVFPEYAKEDVEQFHRMKNCPVCGGLLSDSVDDGYFVPASRYLKSAKYSYEHESFDDFRRKAKLKDGVISKDELEKDINDLFKAARERRLQSANADVRKQIEEKSTAWNVSAFLPDIAQKATDIKSSPESLKKYIFQLLGLETDIYALTQRLTTLYKERFSLTEQIKNEKLEIIAPYQAKLEELKDMKPIPGENTVVKLSAPDKPKAPVYKEAGLFNRKKIEAENAQIKADYDARLREYEKKKEQRRLSVEAFDAETRRLKEEAEREKMLAVQHANEQMRQVAHSVFSENGTHVPLEEMLHNIDDEIAQAENLLQEFYKTRNTLYSYDIIYGKYRDPVALATFYEYLMAGRVERLEGATGAYNLYESEIRANMIISQLSQVISLLEQIKDNQYTIYSEMKSIKTSLNQLSATMETATKSIMAIEQNTTRIANFTEVIANNSNVIAYNSAKTAFYAKKNAELTNALGYMMAIK